MGDVLVRGGIIGHHKGSVRAGGRIVAKFAQDADLTAESDIDITKEVMHSRVHCRGKVSVPRGAISQASGSVTVLNSSVVEDEKSEAPNSDRGESEQAS